MLTPTTIGVVCATVTCVTWGVADYLAARVTRAVGELGALLRIQLVGAPVLATAWFVLRPPLPGGMDLVWISAAAGCFLAGYVSFFYGLRVGVISLVSPISSAGAVVPAVAGVALFGDAFSGARIGGVGLTLMGIAILTADPRAIGSLARDVRQSGVRAGLATLVAWGSGTALLLPAIKHAGAFAPIAILRFEILLVLVAWWAARTAAGRRSGPNRDVALQRRDWWKLVVPASLLDLTAFFAYGVALRDAPAAVAAPIASAYPLVTILIARQHLHERLALREWFGIGVTLAGAAVLGASCCGAP